MHIDGVYRTALPGILPVRDAVGSDYLQVVGLPHGLGQGSSGLNGKASIFTSTHSLSILHLLPVAVTAGYALLNPSCGLVTKCQPDELSALSSPF